MSGPTLRRRQVGGLAVGALAAGALPKAAFAADPTTFVSGNALPGNLDPHQVYDVPMQGLMLNAYDNLYRYQGDPPKIVPWLAESHTVSPDGLDLGIQAPAQRQVPRRQPAHRRGCGLFSFRRVLALALAPSSAFLKILKPESITARRSAHRALQARDVLCAVLRGDPLDQHRQSAGHQGQREGRRLGQDVARLQRRGIGCLQDRPGRLPSARISRHGDLPRSLPGLGRQSQAGEEDRLPTDQGDVDPHPGAAQRHASTAPTPTCRPTRWRRSTSPRSPTSRRTWSCGPSSSA